MIPLKSELPSLDKVFADYRNALQRSDTYTLLDNLDFPLTLLDGEQTVVIPDAEAAEKAFLVLQRYYEDVGMTCLETRYLAPQRISRDFVLVDIIWRMQDEDAITICD